MRSSFARLMQGPRTAAATRAAPRATAASNDPSPTAPLDVGWHESSYELMRGVDVIEFDASEAPLIMASLGDL
jgi:hypothetical protein